MMYHDHELKWKLHACKCKLTCPLNFLLTKFKLKKLTTAFINIQRINRSINQLYTINKWVVMKSQLEAAVLVITSEMMRKSERGDSTVNNNP